MRKTRLTFQDIKGIWSETSKREEAVLLEMFLNCFQDKGVKIQFNTYEEVDEMNQIVDNVSEFAELGYKNEVGKDYEEVNLLINKYLPLYTTYSFGDRIKDKREQDICMMIDTCNGKYFSLVV